MPATILMRPPSISNESAERPAAELFMPSGVTFGAAADFAAAAGRAARAISSKRVMLYVEAARLISVTCCCA